MPLSYAKLQKEFDYVSPYFDGAEWILHKSCINAEPGEMRLKHFGRLISIAEALAEIKKEGFRPATNEELYKWVKSNPDNEEYVVALGAETYVYDNRHVAYTWDLGGERYLSLDWVGFGWGSVCRFLVVRNVSKITLQERLQRIEEEIRKIKEMI